MPLRREQVPTALSSPSRSTTGLSSASFGGESSSSSLSRPVSLLRGLSPGQLSPSSRLPDDNEDEYGSAVAPPRPRRLWKVSDTNLPPIPPLYPPLNPRCTVYVADPPSVVAVRIAECLRIRSVSVEYDEETTSATAMTVDRCHFSIHLWQGKKSSRPPHDAQDLSTMPDFGSGVIVECVRINGSTLSFHRTVRALLSAAIAEDSGRDKRKTYQTSPLEYAHLETRPYKRARILAPTIKRAAGISTSTAVESIEHAVQLLRKDRLGAQVRGMESLVSLTDEDCCGSESAIYTSMALLGAPPTSKLTENISCLSEIHEDWIQGLLVGRRLPSDKTTELTAAEGSFSLSCATSLFDDHNQHRQATATQHRGTKGDEQHRGTMRAMSLRAFTNALTLLAKKKILQSVLEVKMPGLVSQQLLHSLKEDLLGAIRPPTVVHGTSLASQHEAALAIRCLRLLGEHSSAAKQQIKSMDILDLLEKARQVGKSTHEIMEEEAKLAYSQLTVDERSC